jgi:hypothetical protein
MHDAFGAPEADRAWSRRLGGAAMELLWALAADAPAVVIEANFRPRSEYERTKLSGLAARPVEVHCACPPGVALRRYNARTTHPVHVSDRTGGRSRLKAIARAQFRLHMEVTQPAQQDEARRAAPPIAEHNLGARST